MHISRKHITIFVAILILVLLTTVLFLLFKQRTITVAFRDVPESVQSAVTQQLQLLLNQLDEKAGKSKSTFRLETINYPSNTPVQQQLRQKPKVDLLICQAGLVADAATAYAFERKAGVSNSILNTMPQTVAESAKQSNSLVAAIPLLIDHYELAVSTSSDQLPFIFAGGHDSTLLALAGAIAEAAYGTETAKQLAKDATNLAAKEITTLQNVAKILAQGITSQQIPQFCLNLLQEEVAVYMSNTTPEKVFMPLSFHRTLPYESLRRHKSTFMPSNQQSRSFTAPITYAIPLTSRGKTAKTIETLLQMLTGSECQGQLANATGLAPVHATASTPDVQADDLRYWIAASNPPLPPLDKAAFATERQAADFADAFRSMVLEYVNSNTR